MEQFYKMVEASNKRFPNGVEPYQKRNTTIRGINCGIIEAIKTRKFS